MDAAAWFVSVFEWRENIKHFLKKLQMFLSFFQKWMNKHAAPQFVSIIEIKTKYKKHKFFIILSEKNEQTPPLSLFQSLDKITDVYTITLMTNSNRFSDAPLLYLANVGDHFTRTSIRIYTHEYTPGIRPALTIITSFLQWWQILEFYCNGDEF